MLGEAALSDPDDTRKDWNGERNSEVLEEADRD